MSSLVIPPCPNWYESSILACSPDNTLIYGARNDIVLIENSTPLNIPAEVKIISRAHSMKIVAISINRNWNNPNKYIASVGQDKIINVWNADTLKRKIFHNAHINHGKVVAVNFAGDERVVSVSEEGNVIVFNMPLNETSLLSNLFGFKVTVTCMSLCPHANWLSAFGLKNGLVLVVDLRKNGKILHKLRGHDKSVISLSWCPASVNIFPKSPDNYVGTKKIINDSEDTTTPTNIKEINDVVLTNENLSETNNKTEIALDNKLLNNSHITNDSTNQNNQRSTKNFELEDEQKTTSSLLDETLIQNLDSNHKLKNGSDEINVEDDSNEERTLIETPSTLSPKFPNSDIENVENANVTTYLDKIDQNSKQISVEDGGDNGLLAKNVDNGSEPEIAQNVDTESTTENTERQIPLNVAVEEEPRKEFLLASSAKENKIYIWRAGTDGRLQTFLTLPSKPNSRKNYNYEKLWITMHWATPTKLLSSSKSAELLRWTLPKSRDTSNQLAVIHNDHYSQLFSIAGPVMLFNEYNWLDEPNLNIWTIGHDRLLLNTSLTSKRDILSAYPTFGGCVNCLQLSPLDPNRLAIGTNDGFIKLLDLSRPHVRNISMNQFYQKIQSKVMSLAWHPLNEVYLAYGTFEGRVGYLDVSNTSKPPILFSPYFKTQIHKVEYGPLNGNTQEVGLYALSEGNLIRFNPKNPKEDPMVVDKPDDTYIYTFSWKPDYSMLVISTKKNSLIKYSASFEITLTKYIEYKVQDICWHPDASDNSETSKYNNYFASISNSKNVLVFNFDSETVEKDEIIVSKYEGQLDLINNISWSPYDHNHLAIASDIGIGVIWDIAKNVTIASYFCENFDSLSAMLWSPLGKNLMISGGKDQTLRIWKIDDYPVKDELELKTKRKEILKEVQARVTEQLPKNENPEEESVKSKKPTKSSLLPKFYSIVKRQSHSISDLRRLLSWKENPSDVISENKTVDEPNILDLFGPNVNMKNLVKLNENVFSKRGQYNQKTQLSLFGGDISSSIKEAINEKRVNPLIISLAPMVSPKLWQEACETYADQLSQQEESDPIEIATYYLACHKVEEAVDLLCTRSMFQEALVLAKCRFMENDKTIFEIIDKWAKHALLAGNFETSAQCYIFLGKYEDAASVLFRRSDIEILKFAAELAEKSGNIELHKAVMFRYNGFLSVSSKEKDLETTNDKVSEFPSKVHVLVGNTEDALSEDAIKNNSEEMEQFLTKTDNLLENQDIKNTHVSNKSDLLNEESMVSSHVHEIIEKNVNEKSENFTISELEITT